MNYFLTTAPLSAEATWYALPLGARQLDAGVKFSRTLRRAVLADTYILVGDGKPIPEPVTLVMELNAGTPEGLTTLETAIIAAATTATSIMRKPLSGVLTIRRRDVLGLMEMPITLSRGATRAILTLRFGPRSAYWTNQAGTAGQNTF